MPKRHFETPAALPADAFFGGKFMTHVSPNENKMSDGGRDRASLGVGVWKSSQKWSVQRSAVRCIALLVIQQLFMVERSGSQSGRSEAVNNSAALEMIRVDKLMKEPVELVL